MILDEKPFSNTATTSSFEVLCNMYGIFCSTVGEKFYAPFKSTKLKALPLLRIKLVDNQKSIVRSIHNFITHSKAKLK